MQSKQQLAILGVLAVVMIAVYAKALQPPTPSVEPHETAPSVPSVSAPEPSPPPPVQVVGSTQRHAQRARDATLRWGRDPFTRGAALGEVSGLSLSGILWDAASPLAIINGQPVRAGETLEGYSIVSIGHDSVTVSDGTQTFQLTISP